MNKLPAYPWMFMTAVVGLAVWFAHNHGYSRGVTDMAALFESKCPLKIDGLAHIETVVENGKVTCVYAQTKDDRIPLPKTPAITYTRWEGNI